MVWVGLILQLFERVNMLQKLLRAYFALLATCLLVGCSAFGPYEESVGAMESDEDPYYEERWWE